MEKKWFHESNTPGEDRTTADPMAKRLGDNAVDKFAEEKANGKTLKDIKDGTILVKEVADINEYNRQPEVRQHPDLYGNDKHQTLMAQYVGPDGKVADEISSSQTPTQEKDNKDEYYDSFSHLSVTGAQSAVPSSASSSENESSEEDSISHSPRASVGEQDLLNLGANHLLDRENGDSTENSGQSPSQGPLPQDSNDDSDDGSGPSIFEMAGDD